MSRMKYCKLLGRGGAVSVLLAAALLMAGCRMFSADQKNAAGAADTPPQSNGSEDIIHKGTLLIITFSDTVSPIPPFEERVNEEGSITLIENKSFTAEGKTRGQLEKEIRECYVRKYYRRLTVTIKPQERVFYIDGEVRTPGRPAYAPPMTVLKAIASAGGANDFANLKRVTVTRTNGKKEKVNCIKAREDSSKDLPIYPGDSIHVPRTIF